MYTLSTVKISVDFNTTNFVLKRGIKTCFSKLLFVHHNISTFWYKNFQDLAGLQISLGPKTIVNMYSTKNLSA